jgi:PTH1 family peptidyl-tRNA hydrolase
MKLIVGLGNPGEHERDRHSVGFMVIDRLAERLDVSLTTHRFDGLLGRARVGPHDVWLLKPHTFMNESGKCVGAAARFYRLAQEDVLVVYDELDLPFG